MKDKTRGFSLSDTNVVKGVAVCMLLIHHLFYSESSYNLFKALFYVGGTPIIVHIANLCKVCVTIFLILSGYGMNTSINKRLEKTPLLKTASYFTFSLKYSLKHLLKVYLRFWLCFIVFALIGNLSGLRVFEYSGFGEFVIDFLGLYNIFNSIIFGGTGYTYNLTWWYMSLVVITVLIFPFIKTLLKKAPAVLFLVSFSLMTFYSYLPLNSYPIWQFSFVLGIFLSEYNFFSFFKHPHTLKNKISTSLIFLGYIMVLSIIRAVSILGYYSKLKFDSVFATVIILLCYLILSEVKWLNNILKFCGKHSGNIFFFHTFIYAYFFKSFIYSPKYPILIFLLLLAICLVISIALNYIYDLIEKLLIKLKCTIQNKTKKITA